MKWRYKWIWLDVDEDQSIFEREESTLNQYGADGWELVSVVSTGEDSVAAVLKKAVGS